MRLARIVTSVVMAVFLVFVAGVVSAQLVITPSSATSTSTSGGSRTIVYTINGSDLSALGTSGDALSETHDPSTDSAGYWLSASGSVNTNDGVNYWSTTEVLTFTLPEATSVNAIHLWNYDRGGDNPTRALRTFDISFSTDNGVTFPSKITGAVLGDFVGQPARVNDEIPVQSKSFSVQADVTDIKIDNIYIQGGNTYMGFSEIRFGGPPAPGTPVLGAVDALNIASNSVQLAVELSNANADVTVYWDTDTVDEPSTHSGWTGSNGPSGEPTGTVSRTVSGLSPDTEYNYAFYANNIGSGFDAWSAVGSFITAFSAAEAPSFSNAVVGDLYVSLSWLDKAVNETGYILRRSENSSSGPYTYIDAGNATSYIDVVGIEPATTYYYNIAATNSANGSITDFSLAQTSATTLPLAGEVVAEYRFEGSYESTDGNNNTLASSVTAYGHASSVVSGYYEADCADVGGYIGSDYLEFGITLPEDADVSLTALEWNYGTQSAYQFEYGFFSDGYKGFGDRTDVLPATYADTDGENIDVATNHQLVTLAPYVGFQNLSATSVVFRVYIGDGATTAGRKHRFDNIRVYGVDNTPPAGTVLIIR